MASSPTRKHLPPDQVRQKCASQKSCYDNYSEAHTAAEQLMDADRVNVGCHITPYLCDACDKWHVYNRQIVFPASVAPAHGSARCPSTDTVRNLVCYLPEGHLRTMSMGSCLRRDGLRSAARQSQRPRV